MLVRERRVYAWLSNFEKSVRVFFCVWVVPIVDWRFDASYVIVAYRRGAFANDFVANFVRAKFSVRVEGEIQGIRR